MGESEGVQQLAKLEDLSFEELSGIQPDWTADEEAKAKRKLDLTVMPLLMLGFFVLQLDRGNISNAITDTFFEDVGITQDQFNVGQQLLSLGIVLLEIPSNMLLYKLGPGKWMSTQVMAFGVISTFQAFQSNYAGFLVTRLLLGCSESGFIPAGLFTMSTWYTKTETAKRVMIFFLGNLGAAASSNLISYGLLQMGGTAGRPGWFWLFLVMGLVTIASGFVIACFLPDSFSRPRSFLLPRLVLFTDRELHILRRRVYKDDPVKSRKQSHIGTAALKRALTNPVLYAHCLISMTICGPLTALQAYTPKIINSFGYDALKSNALTSVGLWLQLPVAVVFSYLSDHFNLRATTVLVSLTLDLLFQGLLRGYTDSNSRSVRYAIVVLIQIIYFIPHPLNVAWMALNSRDSEERALAMAMNIMAANAAGIYASQIFRADDRPRYHRALTVNVSILAFSLASTLNLALYFRLKSRDGRKTSSPLKDAHEYPETIDSGTSTPASLDSSSKSANEIHYA